MSLTTKKERSPLPPLQPRTVRGCLKVFRCLTPVLIEADSGVHLDVWHRLQVQLDDPNTEDIAFLKAVLLLRCVTQ